MQKYSCKLDSIPLVSHGQQDHLSTKCPIKCLVLFFLFGGVEGGTRKQHKQTIVAITNNLRPLHFPLMPTIVAYSIPGFEVPKNTVQTRIVSHCQ
jgi:hypothetical protein